MQAHTKSQQIWTSVSSVSVMVREGAGAVAASGARSPTVTSLSEMLIAQPPPAASPPYGENRRNGRDWRRDVGGSVLLRQGRPWSALVSRVARRGAAGSGRAAHGVDATVDVQDLPGG